MPFFGVHSNYGVCLIMDEASGIPAPIYSVSEGFFSEPTADRYWFCFSNPRRNTGSFTIVSTANARIGKIYK